MSRPEPGWVYFLAEILRGTPKLENPACAPYPELFDTTEPVDAVAPLEVCGACECLVQCRAWADAQPKGRLSGVVGGEIRKPGAAPSEAKRKKKPRRPKPRPAAVPA